MTRPTEFRALPDQELISRLDASKEELFNLRFQLATGQLDNPMRIKQVRHDVARILTILRERELEIVDRVTETKPETKRKVEKQEAPAKPARDEEPETEEEPS